MFAKNLLPKEKLIFRPLLPLFSFSINTFEFFICLAQSRSLLPLFSSKFSLAGGGSALVLVLQHTAQIFLLISLMNVQCSQDHSVSFFIDFSEEFRAVPLPFARFSMLGDRGGFRSWALRQSGVDDLFFCFLPVDFFLSGVGDRGTFDVGFPSLCLSDVIERADLFCNDRRFSKVEELRIFCLPLLPEDLE